MGVAAFAERRMRLLQSCFTRNDLADLGVKYQATLR
jgi:hypothetical protein